MVAAASCIVYHVIQKSWLRLHTVLCAGARVLGETKNAKVDESKCDMFTCGYVRNHQFAVKIADTDESACDALGSVICM